MSLPAYLPMLAVPAAAPFSRDGWVFEPKWDGVRALLRWDGEAVHVVGRRGDDVTVRYPELAGARFGRPVVVDGEIVALGPDGTPSFEALQSRMHLDRADAAARAAAATPVALVAFDLLHDGAPIVGLPLAERRRRLAALDLLDPIVVSEAVEADGLALWEAVVARDLEGIVAKRLGAPYRPGVRSPDWRKIANVRITRAVVGGYTPGSGGRSDTFGALLLGQWRGGSLRFVGSIGTGFSEGDLREIRAALDHAAAPDSPFAADPGVPADALWVRPALVASVGYRNWTAAGRLRHPRFRGFTGDPSAAVTFEEDGPGA